TLIEVLSEVPDVEDEHLRCVDLLVQQAANYFGRPVTYLSREELEQLLLQIIPAKVAVEPEIAAGLIDAARLVMLFAGHQLGIEPAKEAAEWLTEPTLVKELATALADESRYSPTKAMILEGIRAGHDLTTEEGVAAWVEILNERVQPKTKA
ncbi:MAG TPA: hypothetical protein VLB44_02830, partial [Kofleriaceae bacterium]|nr:hypothetical protein [Kofleriaceae bacterium]